jgi:hypothetical protein
MRTSVGVVVAASLLWPSAALADVIDFTKISLGPSSTLVYKGVTITADEGSAVAMVAGEGLGFVGIGSNGSVNTITHYDAGSLFDSRLGRDGEVTIRVAGQIKSVTIQPYMTINGAAPLPGVNVGFQMSFGLDANQGTGRAYRVMSTPFAPFVFDFTTAPFGSDLRVEAMTLGLFTDIGQEPFQTDYLIANGLPEATFEFGYSIVAMDYAPTEVPEPGTLSLLLIGGGSAWWWRRRHGVVR